MNMIFPPQAKIHTMLRFLASVSLRRRTLWKCRLNMAFSCLLKRLSHAVALARSQPWVLLNHTFQLYQLKIWTIICHMQQLINVHFSESRTMCSKSACSTCCDWSAETENSRELRSPSAGPEDLIGYKYTVHPPATKMELILGFLLPNCLHIQAIHPAPEDLCKTWVKATELLVLNLA